MNKIISQAESIYSLQEKRPKPNRESSTFYSDTICLEAPKIAEAIGVGRATLFRYFKSKKQLIHDLVVESDRKLANATLPIIEKKLNAYDTLEEFIKVLVPLGASFHFLNSEQIYTETTGIEDLYRNQLVRLKNLASRLQEEGIIAPDIPSAWVAAVLDNLIYTAWTTVSVGDIAPNDAPGLVLKSFLHGLAKKNIGPSRTREFS